MVEKFEFEEGGRTYTCHVEKQKGSLTDGWWWFVVTGDGHRYAPFQSARDDTQNSVRHRIHTYHTDLLARRAAPPQARNQWARRGKDGAPAPAPAPAPPQAQAQAQAKK
jgi:hypothetical protein